MIQETPDSGSLYRDKDEFYTKLNENYDQIRVINTTGGGGIIYAGIHRRLSQKVVLKRIRSKALKVLDREMEKQALMELKHTYLPRIVDFWSFEDETYTVMEFIEGKSLQEHLDNGRRFSQKEVIRLTRQLAEVLKYLHESPRHIIHCDVKPANIMLTPEDNICLIDFNIAVSAGGKADDTVGYSVGYSPVEQILSVDEFKRRRREKAVQNAQAQAAQAQAAQALANPVRGGTVIDDAPVRGGTVIDDAPVRGGTVIDDALVRGGTVIDDAPVRGGTIIDDAPVRGGTIIDDAPVRGGTVLDETPAEKPATRTEAARQEATVMDEGLERMRRRYGTRLRMNEYSDIYAACATMYHLLTGRMPESCFDTITPVEVLVPSVNDAFAQILMHGLEQDPKKRFSTSAKFLKALNNLAKSTRRYRRMRISQDLVTVLLVIVFAAGTVSAALGFKRWTAENSTDRLQAAAELYGMADYEGALVWLQEKVFDLPSTLGDVQMAQAYYIAGNCSLNMADYPDAVSYYQKAIFLDSGRPEYYRDYGIALARSGNAAMAEETLEQARARGLGSDDLLLLSGEIHGALGNLDAAIDELTRCASQSEDESIRVRAALKLDDLVTANSLNDHQAQLARREILEPIYETLHTAARLPLMSRMAQLYLEMGQGVTGVADENLLYITMAADLLRVVLDEGYATLQDWLNLAICHQNTGSFREGMECLDEAEKRYPKNYRISLRRAYLAVSEQAERDEDERDYTAFKEAYDRCMALYNTQNHSEPDPEVTVLEQIYNEAVRFGWLTE